MRFLVGALAVWRVTHLLGSESGPWGVMERVRQAVKTGVLGDLLSCFYCLSFWIAAPVALLTGSNWRSVMVSWPALSAGAILVEEALDRLSAAGPEPARFVEEAEDGHAVLRPAEHL
jgi:uncharacterized protein DUF1360